MNDMLKKLQEKNPGIRLYAVTDPEFEAYGRVIEGADTAQLHAALENTPIPAEGNMYRASEPALEEMNMKAWLGDAVYGRRPIQLGFCNGRGYTMNALEYHKCGEVNYSTTGCILLMATQRDLHEGRLNSRDVVGFYLPAGVLVEVRAEVFHFAPCRIFESGFNCMVALEAGVNAEFDEPVTVKTGEAAMLWRVGKWMIAHSESPQAKLSAYVGIDGENLKVNCE